jgi:hypothetical protein
VKPAVSAHRNFAQARLSERSDRLVSQTALRDVCTLARDKPFPRYDAGKHPALDDVARTQAEEANPAAE